MSSRNQPAASGSTGAGPVRIVVAEDDELLEVAIQSKLSHAGYLVIAERDGKSAWGAILAKLPDLIILDWMMPGLNGLELLALIRDNPKTSKIPVLMLTAVAEADQVKTAIIEGANDYVVKPFKAEDLLQRAAKLLKLRVSA